MPVVTADWRAPGSWLKPRTAYGVIRDGADLRFCRRNRSGRKQFFHCGVAEWEGEAAAEFRTRLLKDLAAGALLSAGLEPHRVMLRNLESPLKDPGKSGEIWGTLLDAAIPFSLEKCLVTFLPLPPADSGSQRALAVAARIADLETVMSEWEERLGRAPDLILPEQLLFPDRDGHTLWLGQSRTVFTSWKEGAFCEGGGALQAGQRAKLLTRYAHSLPEASLPLTWKESGPASGNQENLLEEALADAVFDTDPLHANLRADLLAADSLSQRYRKKRKTLGVCGVLLLMLLVLFPLLLRQQMRAYQNVLQADISEAYRHFTGTPNNARGQELLLARRFREERWGGLQGIAERVSAPRVSASLAEILETARAEKLALLRLEVEPDRFKATVVGSKDQRDAFTRMLIRSGWRTEVQPDGQGTWKLSAGRAE